MTTEKRPLLDRESPVPLHYQVQQDLLRLIRDWSLESSEPLPSEKELQDRYGVSRITVRRALSDLVLKGYLSRQPGRGTFVVREKIQKRSERLGGFIDDLTAQGYQVQVRTLECKRVPAPPNMAAKLGLTDDHSVYYLKRLFNADGEPIALSRAWYALPQGLVLTIPELDGQSVYPLIERKCGIRVARAVKTIEPVLPLGDEAELLHINSDSLLLLIESQAFDAHDRSVGIIKSLYRGDRYKYVAIVTR